MDTKITSENPYRYGRHGFVWGKVPKGEEAHWDFGCYDAAFLKSLECKCIRRLVGVDISQEAINRAHNKFPEIETIHITKTVPLPFDDGSFALIAILDVFEHVYEQIELLKELCRVLDDDGVMIVTVPGKHLFSFLDRGNFKFYFPKLHKWYYCLKHSEDEYQKRYVSNLDGLVGDVSVEKGFHEHFSRKKLRNLLNEAGFVVINFDGTGFFSRIIGHISFFFNKVRFFHSFLQKINEVDSRLFKSANLFCIVRKE